MGIDVEAEVLRFATGEDTFFGREFDVVFAETIKAGAEVAEMVFMRLRKDQNIVNVRDSVW